MYHEWRTWLVARRGLGWDGDLLSGSRWLLFDERRMYAVEE
jgi:hypothetical protein